MTNTTIQATAREKNTPLVVGLTGGIGSGKSTVAQQFSSLGITVVDSDQLAHELVIPGEPAFTEIVETFGPAVISSDGTLDRDQLRQRVFADPAERKLLEAILHPGIRTRMQDQLAAVSGPYCIAAIPLLLETAQTNLVDRILVIDTPETLQRQRVAERDGLQDAAISDIIATQTDRNTRLQAADDVISNDRDLAALASRVRELHDFYQQLATT